MASADVDPTPGTKLVKGTKKWSFPLKVQYCPPCSVPFEVSRLEYFF